MKRLYCCESQGDAPYALICRRSDRYSARPAPRDDGSTAGQKSGNVQDAEQPCRRYSFCRLHIGQRNAA